MELIPPNYKLGGGGLRLDELPQTLRDQLSQALEPGEKVAWCAQPLPRPRPTGPLLPIALGTSFVFMLGVGALMILLSGAGDGKPADTWGSLGLSGLFLPVVGLVFWLWGRHNLRLSAARTCYCVTDRRVVILDSGFCDTNGPSVMGALSQSPYKVERRTLAPGEIDDLRCTEHEDGSGDVILKSVLIKDNEGITARSEIGFYSVPRAREAEEAVRSLVRARAGDA